MSAPPGRSRVQGPWSTNQSSRRRGNNNKKGQGEGQQQRNAGSHCSTTNQLVKTQQRTDFMSRPLTFDNSVPREQAINCNTRDTIISEGGEYVISDTAEHGKSLIVYIPRYIGADDAGWMTATLRAELPWRRRSGVTSSGERFVEPRMTSWFSDHDYTYSRVTQPSNSNWHPLLRSLQDKLARSHPSYQFNSVLANLYEDGRNSVAWHADDEPALGPRPQIASISFGDTRTFQLKRNIYKDDEDEKCPKIRIDLTSGSLLLMLGATQIDWLHRVPREYHDRDERINLTFRNMYP